MNSPLQVDPDLVLDQVRAALAEDLGTGDLSARAVPAEARAEARVITRDGGVIAGRPWFDAAFELTDSGIRISWLAEEGGAVEAGTELCRLAGPARSILSAERTALNFLQLLSGAATLARRYVDAIAGTGARILDTRKTLPGLRQAQKYAVRAGGGSNHRSGLFDAILLKENHIAAGGGISATIAAARRAHGNMPIEVEVEDLAELDQAVAAGADRALLDNFSPADLRAAVAAHATRIELEASGGITLESVRAIAETGVHCISVGELTKRVEPLDLTLLFD